MYAKEHLPQALIAAIVLFQKGTVHGQKYAPPMRECGGGSGDPEPLKIDINLPLDVFHRIGHIKIGIRN